MSAGTDQKGGMGALGGMGGWGGISGAAAAKALAGHAVGELTVSVRGGGGVDMGGPVRSLGLV